MLEPCTVDFIQPVEELGELLISGIEDSCYLMRNKFKQESKKLEGAYVMESEFDTFMHEVTKVDEVEELDTMVLFED